MNKQKGFSAVIILLALVVIVAVGFAGYYVWNKNKTEEPVAANNSINTSEPDESLYSFKDSEKDGYKVYTDSNLGFSIEVPSQFNEGECKLNNTEDDGMGNVTEVDPYYSADFMLGPSKVFKSEINKDTTYITTEKYLKFTESDNGNETRLVDCKKTDVTDSNVESGPSYMYIDVTKTDKEDIEKVIEEKYNTYFIVDNKYKYSVSNINFVETENSSYKTIKYKAILSPDPGFQGGFRVEVRYYEDKQLLAIWPLGQSCNLFNEKGPEICEDIVNSFKAI
jgi:hypothetical protein